MWEQLGKFKYRLYSRWVKVPFLRYVNISCEISAEVFRGECHENCTLFPTAQEKEWDRTQTWQNVHNQSERVSLFMELFFQLFCKFENFQNKTLGKTNSSDASELNRTKTSKNPPLARVLKMPSSQCMKGSELVCRKAEVPRCKVTPRSPARTTGRDHTAICWGGWHGRRSQF